MKFVFGDIVVVERNLIGVVVRDWLKSTYDNKIQPHHEVYVRYFNEIRDYSEDCMERYMVRHKYLDGAEVIYQSNAVNNKLDAVLEDSAVIHSPSLTEIFYDDCVLNILKSYNIGVRQRALNCLFRTGIRTLDDFFEKSPESFNYIRNLGTTTKRFIVDTLFCYCENYGITPQYKRLDYSINGR